jgi:putative addiction module component (TIGR02574 family)
MSEKVKQLVEEARRLSPEEQADLLDALLVLAHTPSPEWEKAWSEECERRWEAYVRGEEKLYTWEEVKAQLSKL